MDLLETMAILVAVDEGGSLSEASRRLKIPLATVSRKISELESQLQVKLMIRNTRAVEFTDAGRSYLGFCRRITDDVEDARRTVTGEYKNPKGQLKITAPIVFGRLHLLPIVAKFLQAYPEVDVQLLLTDRSIDLLEEKVDLALRIGELPSSSLMALRLGFIRTITCCSPDYRRQWGVPQAPDELSKHVCISLSVLGSGRKWDYRIGKNKSPVSVHSRLEVSTPEAALDAAALGLGITRALSYQVMKHKRQQTLELILTDFEPEPWPVHFVYPEGRVIPVKLRVFLDFASPLLKRELSEISQELAGTR